jgi:hypothetical protein
MPLSDFDVMMIDTKVSVFLDQVRDECKSSHCEKMEEHVFNAAYDCAMAIMKNVENPYKEVLSKLRNEHRLHCQKIGKEFNL